MSLRLFLFGAPHLHRDGKPIHIRRRRSLAMVAYLALNPGRHSRDRLAALFYPESHNALTYVRRDLHEIRQVLGAKSILTTELDVGMASDGALWVDVAEFERLIATGGQGQDARQTPVANLQAAVDLYRDGFLAGFTLPDCPQFDEWQFFLAESLRQRLDDALRQLVEWHVEAEAYDVAIELSRRRLSLDNLNEVVHRELMRLYTWSGQRMAALRQYQECVSLLDEGLGVPPEEKTTALYQAIRDRRYELLGERQKRKSKAAAAGQEALAHNLPAQATSFVGRRNELTEIRRILTETDCRLLTLLGPGGVGKTRLALEAAARLAFADGRWFVALAEVDDAAAVAATIADSLGIRLFGSTSAQEALFDRLRDQELLLLLDNFEQLMASGGADFVVSLLRNTHGLRLLITSRERLDLNAEWLFPVGGLAVPASDGEDDPLNSGAAQLFLQRARRTRPDLGYLPDEQAAVARICRLVEGFPLALELAAAWVVTLSCEEIADEIEENLDFLATTMRDLPPRQRSMRATFEHSWRLLTVDERAAFSQLSVFRGGFTRRAARQVVRLATEDGRPGIGQRSRIDGVLASLAGKSFLKRRADLKDDSGRFEVHELMRQFGEAKLKEDKKREMAVRGRHSNSYLTFCIQQESRLKGSEQQAALDACQRDSQNIRTAFKFAVEEVRIDAIIKACESIWLSYGERNRYFQAHDTFTQAIETLEAARHKENGQRQLALAMLKVRRAGFQVRLGAFKQARADLSDGLNKLEGVEAGREIALAQNLLAALLHQQGEYALERQYLEESIELARAARDRWLLGYSLNDLGMVTHLLGDTRDAERLSRESLGIFQDIGDQRGRAFALCNLGTFASSMGETENARRFLNECLILRQANGDDWGAAGAYFRLGSAAAAEGDRRHALQQYRQALAMCYAIKAYPLLLDVLVALAALLSGEGEEERAAEILGHCLVHPSLSHEAQHQAEALAAELGPAIEADDRPQTYDSLDALITSLLSD